MCLTYLPSGDTAPIKNNPTEVDVINKVADGREQRKLQQTIFFDGRRSERGRQVKAKCNRKTTILRVL